MAEKDCCCLSSRSSHTTWFPSLPGVSQNWAPANGTWVDVTVPPPAQPTELFALLPQYSFFLFDANPATTHVTCSKWQCQDGKSHHLVESSPPIIKPVLDVTQARNKYQFKPWCLWGFACYSICISTNTFTVCKKRALLNVSPNDSPPPPPPREKKKKNHKWPGPCIYF